MINYLVRLGWSHGDQEIFSRDELIKYFSLENINKSAAVFNPEKLLWVNSHYIKTGNLLKIAGELKPHLIRERLITDDASVTDKEIVKVIPLLLERSKTLLEMAKGMEFYFIKDIKYDEKAKEKFFTPSIRTVFERLIDILSKTDDFSHSSIEAIFNKLTAEFNIKLGNIAQPVRLALTGKTVSPGIFEVILVLGKKSVIERLKLALNSFQ